VKKSHSSRQWLRRHVNDPYVQRSKREGYRSRSAYKLIEIDERDRLLRPGQVIVDLGSAPGGWSQVAAKRVGEAGLVVAIDLLPMESIAGVTFVQGDFTSGKGAAAVQAALGGRQVDLVMSDMAPNMTGIAVTDQARAMYEEPETRKVSRESAVVEAEGYCRWTRVEEIVQFAKRDGGGVDQPHHCRALAARVAVELASDQGERLGKDGDGRWRFAADPRPHGTDPDRSTGAGPSDHGCGRRPCTVRIAPAHGR